MHSKLPLGHLLLLSAVAVALASPAWIRAPKPAAAPSVILQRLPEGAIQPQAAVDSRGIVHVVFFKGSPEAGDIYYYRYPSGAGPQATSRPVRVNSRPETAM